MVAGDQADPDIAVGEPIEHGLGRRPGSVGQAQQTDRREFGLAQGFQQIGIGGGRGGLLGAQLTLGHRQHPQATGGHLVDLLGEGVRGGLGGPPQRRREHLR